MPRSGLGAVKERREKGGVSRPGARLKATRSRAQLVPELTLVGDKREGDVRASKEVEVYLTIVGMKPHCEVIVDELLHIAIQVSNVKRDCHPQVGRSVEQREHEAVDILWESGYGDGQWLGRDGAAPRAGGQEGDWRGTRGRGSGEAELWRVNGMIAYPPGNGEACPAAGLESAGGSVEVGNDKIKVEEHCRHAVVARWVFEPEDGGNSSMGENTTSIVAGTAEVELVAGPVGEMDGHVVKKDGMDELMARRMMRSHRTKQVATLRQTVLPSRQKKAVPN